MKITVFGSVPSATARMTLQVKTGLFRSILKENLMWLNMPENIPSAFPDSGALIWSSPKMDRKSLLNSRHDCGSFWTASQASSGRQATLDRPFITFFKLNRSKIRHFQDRPRAAKP
ncbi:MAG TPA: hypothetical protein VGG97_08525 [Bryobacteraceae bacterium]